MKRAVKFSIPMALVVLRLIAGPLYLALGSVPVSPTQLCLLLLAGATDLVDGSIARAWKVTSTLGRFLDPIADRLIIACVLLKLALAGVLPWWPIWLLAAQYVVLAGVFLWATARRGQAPPADFWAKLGAAIAAVAGVVGLTTMLQFPTLALVLLFAVANTIYGLAISARVSKSREMSEAAR